MCSWFLKQLPFHLNHRPLIPVSKLTVSEPYENYMSRSYQVTKDILSDCKNTGEGRSIWKQFWRGRPVELNLGVCPRTMLLPA